MANTVQRGTLTGFDWVSFVVILRLKTLQGIMIIIYLFASVLHLVLYLFAAFFGHSLQHF